MRARCSNQLAAAMCLLVPLAAGFLLPAPRVPISGGGGCALSGCSGGMVGGPVLAIKQHRGLRGLCTLLSMSGGRDGAIRSASNRVKSALSRAAAGWGGNEALLVSVVDDLAVPILRRADRNAGEEQLILMLTSVDFSVSAVPPPACPEHSILHTAPEVKPCRATSLPLTESRM